MMESTDPKTENLLKSATPKPAPQGLRERVIKAASMSRSADPSTTPLLRLILAGCAGIVLVVLAADALAGKNETSRLHAMLRVAPSNSEDAAPICFKDDLADPLITQWKADQIILFADGKASRRTRRDFRNIEKEILREEYDGN